MPDPGLYVGTLRHQRFTPTSNTFTYPLFMTLLDIDALPELMRVSPLTSYNRFNWASFHDTDHLGPESLPLRVKLQDAAHRDGVTLPNGQILLLTHLRYLGYVFNPVSFYYCYDTQGTLQMVVAEVNNTFGGQQTYWLTGGTTGTGTGSLAFRVPKTLYVSPFLRVELDWLFVFSQLKETMLVHMMAVEDGKGTVLDATLRLARQPWRAAAVHKALLRFPVMTASVILAIHWQALRLYLKGVPIIPRRTKDGTNVRQRPDIDANAGAPGR